MFTFGFFLQQKKMTQGSMKLLNNHRFSPHTMTCPISIVMLKPLHCQFVVLDCGFELFMTLFLYHKKRKKMREEENMRGNFFWVEAKKKSRI